MIGQHPGRGEPRFPFDGTHVDALGSRPRHQFGDVHALSLRKPLCGVGRSTPRIKGRALGGTQHVPEHRRLLESQFFDDHRETTRGSERPETTMSQALLLQHVFQYLSQLRHGRLNHLPRQLLRSDFQQQRRRGRMSGPFPGCMELRRPLGGHQSDDGRGRPFRRPYRRSGRARSRLRSAGFQQGKA